jgi:hypothetical protein
MAAPMDSLNILVLVGSPRNEESWTYKGIRIIEEKMREIQPVNFEYIFVQRLNVPFCDGCLKCISVGETACPDYATIGPIAEKMKKADSLILGSRLFLEKKRWLLPRRRVAAIRLSLIFWSRLQMHGAVMLSAVWGSPAHRCINHIILKR